MRRNLARLSPLLLCLLVYASCAYCLNNVLPAQPLYRLPPHECIICFSPCDRWLLSCRSDDRMGAVPPIRVREASTGLVVHELFLDTEHFTRCRFSEDGGWLVVHDPTTLNYLWNVSAGALIWKGKAPQCSLEYEHREGLELSPQGRFMLLTEQGHPYTELREIVSQTVRLRLPVNIMAAFSADDRYLATSWSPSDPTRSEISGLLFGLGHMGIDGPIGHLTRCPLSCTEVLVWDLNASPPRLIRFLLRDVCTGLAISDREVAAGGKSGVVWRWSLDDGRALTPIPPEHNPPYSLLPKYLGSGFLSIQDRGVCLTLWDLTRDPPCLLADLHEHPSWFCAESGWLVEEESEEHLGDIRSRFTIRSSRSGQQRTAPNSSIPIAFISQANENRTLLILEKERFAENSELWEQITAVLRRVGIELPSSSGELKVSTCDVESGSKIGTCANLTLWPFSGRDPNQSRLSPKAHWIADYCSTEVWEIPSRASLTWVLTLPIVPVGVFATLLWLGRRWWKKRLIECSLLSSGQSPCAVVKSGRS